jgi:hypothetical protein
MTARQVGSDATTDACTRLLLLQFSGTSQDTATIAAALKDSFGGHPALLQTRLFQGIEPAPDFMLAICGFAGLEIPALDLRAFGTLASRITLAATYRPYRR